MKIAILASGNGTNAQAIIDKIAVGVLNASIGVVLSDRPDARVLQRAQAASLPYKSLNRKDYADRVAFDLAFAEIIRTFACDTVVLAGYMRLLSPEFLNYFPMRVLNIHPALLPSFPGTHGIEDALNYGVKLTGPSVHFVEEKMDSGPLVIQAAVPVNAGEDMDCLANRIHALEHRIYPQALQWLAKNRLRVAGRQVYLEKANVSLAPDQGEFFVWPPLEEGF